MRPPLPERILQYVVLVMIALLAVVPFVILLIMSFKTRIEILQVPPSLDFDIDPGSVTFHLFEAIASPDRP